MRGIPVPYFIFGGKILKSEEDSCQNEVRDEKKLNITSEEQHKEKHEQGKKKQQKKQHSPTLWVVRTFFLTLFLSIAFSVISEIVLRGNSIILAFAILIALIVIATMFDVVATAITACNIEPFYAMASRKIKGAKTAVQLLRSAEKVASFCGDVMGDICGVVSGAAGATIAIVISTASGAEEIVVATLSSALISGLMVGCKAVGKQFALKNSSKIIHLVAKMLSVFKKEK